VVLQRVHTQGGTGRVAEEDVDAAVVAVVAVVVKVPPRIPRLAGAGVDILRIFLWSSSDLESRLRHNHDAKGVSAKKRERLQRLDEELEIDEAIVTG
jgi:Sec-independent protein translocase protein TatA